MQSQAISLALTTGLSPGAKLRENRMMEFTKTGIRFSGDLTLEQWQETVALWRTVRLTYFTGLADIIAYGKEKFGEEKVKETLAQYEFDLNDELKALSIGQLPLVLRSGALSEEHYYVLGKFLDNDEDRAKWVKLVEENKLTAYELQRSIEAGNVVNGDDLKSKQGRNSGFLTIHSLSARFEVWERNVGGEAAILSMDEINRRALLKELEGPGELYLKLKSQLAN